MKLHVKLLIGCLTSMGLNGCGSSLVFGTCVTPDVDRTILDVTPKDDILENAKRVVGNCQLLKQENEALRKANGVCK